MTSGQNEPGTDCRSYFVNMKLTIKSDIICKGNTFVKYIIIKSNAQYQTCCGSLLLHKRSLRRILKIAIVNQKKIMFTTIINLVSPSMDNWFEQSLRQQFCRC